MDKTTRRGTSIGFLLALLVIVGQPFFPLKGLIPETVCFLTTVPLWLAGTITQSSVAPLWQGFTIIVYFVAVGTLIGAAFSLKSTWGWLLILLLGVHHYIIYERMSLQMAEIMPAVLKIVGWS